MRKSALCNGEEQKILLGDELMDFQVLFLSSALYSLCKMQESSIWLYWPCQYSPFTYCVELLRFLLFGQLYLTAFSVILSATVTSQVLALISFSPKFSQ